MTERSNAMANPIYEFDPVTHITADALGRPGHRSFYIQAVRGLDRITLLCEKEQVQALAEAIDEMLDNLEKQYSLMRDKDLVGRGSLHADPGASRATVSGRFDGAGL